MTDQEIDKLSTAIAEKLKEVLKSDVPHEVPRETVVFRDPEPTPVVDYPPKKRGWPKGKKRKSWTK